ncbi:hypothetical protein [Actinacidiphila yeochonensis]|uniref:hypothetical protein n=1 Tax=Actinacidiphila yeochonensis TaxID=89050 RepID=UPI000B0D7DEE|nr:hypothetical protein [Actinacidiphila yeochonensis]
MSGPRSRGLPDRRLQLPDEDNLLLGVVQVGRGDVTAPDLMFAADAVWIVVQAWPGRR